MITLAGFAVSNYYNKVKIALIEKGVPFEEELNWASKDEATHAAGAALRVAGPAGVHRGRESGHHAAAAGRSVRARQGP